MLLLLCMYALFAAELPLAKLALRETNAFFLETIRMVIGGTFLLGYCLLRDKSKIYIDRKDWGLFAQLILFYMYLSYFAGGWALQYISSLKANAMYSLVPFVSAALGYLILRDKPTLNKIIGMSIGVAGLGLILLLTSDHTRSPLGEFMHISMPEIMMLVSIFSTEYGYFLLKRLFDKGYSLVLINGLAMFIGGFLSLASALLVFQEQVIQYSSLWAVVGYAGLLFVIINVIDIAFYGKLIKKYSITFLTFAGFLSPIFGVLYSTVFMGETISLAHVGAFSLILFGLYLYSRNDLKISEAGTSGAAAPDANGFTPSLVIEPSLSVNVPVPQAMAIQQQTTTEEIKVG
jgi:drug/metabolite transporter (DMT)-like permease